MVTVRTKDELQRTKDQVLLTTVHCFYRRKFIRRRRSWKRGAEESLPKVLHHHQVTP